MNAPKKFTPRFGTKADKKRMEKINKVFDYAAKVYPKSMADKELSRIRKEMNKRRPRTLTRDEADYVIGICLDGGLNLKQQLKDLLRGFKPTRIPSKAQFGERMKELKQRFEFNRTQTQLNQTI